MSHSPTIYTHPNNYREYKLRMTTDLLTIEPPTELQDKGNMTVRIPNTDNAKHSPYNKYLHVKSATGYSNPGFQTEVTFKDVPRRSRAKYYMRCYLTRDHSSARHIPVDKVCDKHIPQKDPLPTHVLRHQPRSNPGIIATKYAFGRQPSLLFQLQPPENNTIKTTIRMYLMCYDTCVNMQNPDPKTPTKYITRDLRLVQTLEIHKRGHKQITHQRTRLIWPKAAIVQREFIMNPRRGPQGGLASKQARLKGKPVQKGKPKNYLKQMGTGTWNIDKDWVNKFLELRAPKGEATLTLTRDLVTGQTNAIMKSSYPIQWPQ